MGKEILTIYQAAHEKTMHWMEKAIQEGALSKLPHRTTQKQWEKQQDIGITYTFGDVTYKDLGQIHDCTRENVRQIKRTFMINLYENSSPPLQAEYPWREISLPKPQGQKSRERHSEARGGLSLKAKELIEKGIIDPKRIKDTLNIQPNKLCHVRKTLKEWGIDMPRTRKPTIKKERFERIEKENDDKKLQEFLDSFSVSSLIRFLQKDSDHETLTTVSIIANEQGFHARTRRVRFIAETIKEAKIPIRQTASLDKNGKLLSTYYIVCSKHTERIAEALRNDPDLQRFR